MKRSFAVFSLLSLFAVSVVHCKKKTPVEDAAAPIASDTATAEPTTPPAKEVLAANSDAIARFENETKLDGVAATVTTYSANMRESPPNGPVVAVVPKGTQVTQIAQRDQYFLVTFDNPKNPSEKLMGWAFGPALGAPSTAPVASTKVLTLDASAPKPPTSCPAGQTLVMADLPICAKVCEADKDCPTGQACKGSASRIVNGKAGDGVTTCVVYHPHDAGAPTPTPTAVVDAGTPAAKDAAAPIPTVTPDAGGSAPSANGPEIPAVGGKCVAGYVFLAKDGKCHKDCTAGAVVCGSLRCTKKCGTGPAICLSNAALCP